MLEATARGNSMNHDEVRQLIRIRHELRRLMPANDQNGARRLLARMRALTARDSRERASVEPEIERWQSAFQLAAL
jgi:hypothetical protein